MDFVSSFVDVSHLHQASLEMEKRTVGIFHELLSLLLHKRVLVPILGKFTEEYGFSSAFSSVFTRHLGIFYLSLKGGIKTAMLRDAYTGSELIDRDPLLEIHDKFVQLLEEGWRKREEQLRVQRENVVKDEEMLAMMHVNSRVKTKINADSDCPVSSGEPDGEEIDIDDML